MSVWQSPSELSTGVEALRIADPLERHGFQFWRDAWIASQFAIATGAEKVRLLHPAQFPDFAIMLDGVETWYEATEAMRPERRRGDEFKEDPEKLARGENPIALSRGLKSGNVALTNPLGQA